MESLLSLFIANKVLCRRHCSTSLFYDIEGQRLRIYAVPDLFEQHDLPINKENYVNQVQLYFAIK